MKKINFAIIGLGGRGGIYAHFINHYGREITAVCDVNEKKESLARSFGAREFFPSEEAFFACKRADVLVVATLDTEHYRHAIKGLELGYDLLLEKPIAMTLEECEGIERTAKCLNRKVLVCHVLRYSPFYGEIKRLLENKEIGDITSLSMTEEIGYYHYAHSYVRGNWRNEKIAAPLILAKNCHDMDMICWLIGKDCKTVTSFGDLSFFKKENAPENAAAYCFQCPKKAECPFNAEYIYTNEAFEKIAGLAKHGGLGKTKEEIAKNLSDPSNPYARCVFRSDNDVCDHQVVNLEFEGNTYAQFTSTAFSQTLTRRIVIYGTNGHLYGEDHGDIVLQKFGNEPKTIPVSYDDAGYSNHSGGDIGIIKQLLEYLEEGKKPSSVTEIERSVLSHKIGFFAEISRKNGGAPQKIG